MVLEERHVTVKNCATNRAGLLLCTALLCLLSPPLLPLSAYSLPCRLYAVDVVTHQRDGQQVTTKGTLVETPSLDTLLLMTADSHYHPIDKQSVVQHTSDSTPFEYADKDVLSRRLQREFGRQFHVRSSAHYVICSSASAVDTNRCHAALERLFKGFFAFWKNRGLPLTHPPNQLVIVLHGNREMYHQHGQDELGDAVSSVQGYYSQKTNRVNLLALDVAQRNGISGGASGLLASRTMATVIHEATHQLSYNSGLQTRFAPHPLWFSEGLAVFFEPPNLKTQTGYQPIGSVSPLHLGTYRAASRIRKVMKLEQLVSHDRAFRDLATIRMAYAQSWALAYFLIRTRRREFLNYLETQGAKQPLSADSSELRLRDFEEAFGGTMRDLQREFQRYMQRVK
jgi:hypothetical protein